jgi:hypothetical protein
LLRLAAQPEPPTSVRQSAAIALRPAKLHDCRERMCSDGLELSQRGAWRREFVGDDKWFCAESSGKREEFCAREPAQLSTPSSAIAKRRRR